MSEMMKLAEIVEKANGPDRELDARIWCVLNGKRYKSHWQAYQSEETQVEYTEPGKRKLFASNRGNHAKQWTGSLDAAMTLAGAADDPLDILEEALASAREERDGIYFLPLHICAAALKARAHLEGV
ncbi:hypothetical protein [Sphingobium fuliginis]|jgi:hypothetical protein|uniref:hypothetical protein n=1 Tax=Sphingobium fuliginis (strain ATCC 27551) TaxID=336203 RepID=UPI0037C94033